jgi:hypothetical protein
MTTVSSDPTAGEAHGCSSGRVLSEESSSKATTSSDTGDFWNALKKVAEVDSKSLSRAGIPSLGPIAGPIAAVVGVTLGLASRTSGSSGHDLSTIEKNPSTPEEIAARAILAEGALQAVLGLDAAKAADLGILSRMQEIYEINKEAVTAFAPVIGPTILAPTIQPALMEIAHDDPSEIKFPEINISSADEAIMANIGFVQDLQQAAQIHTTSTDEKGFWDIMKVVSKVAAEAPKMAAQAAIDQMKNLASSNAPLIQTHDLMALETFALNQSSPNEIAANTIGAVSPDPKGEGGTSIAPQTPLQDQLQPYFETLLHRSLLSEAALDAAISLPEVRTQGFMDTMVENIRKIGPIVIKVAPKVLGAAD